MIFNRFIQLNTIPSHWPKSLKIICFDRGTINKQNAVNNIKTRKYKNYKLKMKTNSHQKAKPDVQRVHCHP